MTVMDPTISIQVDFTAGATRRTHRVVSNAVELETAVHEAITFVHRTYGDGNTPHDDDVWITKVIAERIR